MIWRYNSMEERQPLQRRATLLLLLLLLSACICQQPASGLGAQERQKPSLQRETEEPTIAGGFTEITLDEPAVLEAHAFLMEELQKTHPDILLGTVTQAARQIVAGTNIRLVCEYRVPPSQTDHELTTTVYFDLKGKLSLRSIDLGAENER